MTPGAKVLCLWGPYQGRSGLVLRLAPRQAALVSFGSVAVEVPFACLEVRP